MKTILPFKPFFCHKVLPLTYDDSLSYYEILCKLVHSLNLTIENVAELGGDFQRLYDFVINYFDNLDLQEEIDNTIDRLIETGEFWVYFKSIIGFVTPTMYGALGDGINDDTEAFIDCYADASTLGLNVKIFKGTYSLPSVDATILSQDTRTECLDQVILQLSSSIQLYNSEWYGGHIMCGTTGFILQSGKNKVEKAIIDVAGGNGISCQYGTGIIEDCTITNTFNAVMGIWSDANEGVNNQYVLQIHNCRINSFRKNGIFTSAKACDIAYNILDGNHTDTEPYGGGQIDVVGKQTQGYTTVRNNIIQNGGSEVTSGIELDWSGNAEIFGNVINVGTSHLYGVVLQSSSTASVHDNTIIGDGESGSAIACTGDDTKVNILRTHNNWLFNCYHNVLITNQVSIVSLDEERFTGDLIYSTGSHRPIIDVNNGYMWEGTLEANEGCNFYVSGQHNLKFVVQRTVHVEGNPDNYVTDVLVDGDNGFVVTSSQSSDFTFADNILTYGNNTLGQTVLVKVMTVN